MQLKNSFTLIIQNWDNVKNKTQGEEKASFGEKIIDGLSIKKLRLLSKWKRFVNLVKRSFIVILYIKTINIIIKYIKTSSVPLVGL